ncbi:hypothetical protein ACRALDRAFT_1074206 [Sodiomyces alcalophilus JCM 7366]|uniref:uncharacterized protein n=1 Tax=Sodiomyces alcalophilus JCM 7366 TaxID=591952 RepID=UPI0039B5CCC8
MLAVQRPRMGSSQPSDASLPFGYSVDASQDCLLDPPPEPAPGAPLLSDNDQKMISSFFDDLTSDHYNLPSFGEGLNFTDAWLQLPPQFMGTSTSLAQTSSAASLLSPGTELHHHGLLDMMSMGTGTMAPPPPPPPPAQPHASANVHSQPSAESHPSAEVLAAASVLQNGASPRAPATPLFPSRDMHIDHSRHQPMDSFRPPEHGNGYSNTGFAQVQHVNTFPELLYGSAPVEGQMAASTSQQSQPPVEVQWGSDLRFSSQNFIPESSTETMDAISKDQMRYIDCLEPSQSAANTQPSTPNGDFSSHHTQVRQAPQATRTEEVQEGPPRKRQKSRNAKGDAEEGEDGGDEDAAEGAAATSSKGPKKRKPKSGAPSRRRKAGAGAKPPRENLTEAQKRENHIRSEQKRRTIIKEGFEELCELVPGLKGGGFSKSTMLTMAAEWLEDILRGNEQLAAQLSEIESRQ